MSFKKNKYVVVRDVISKDVASFLCDYFKVKRQAFDVMREVGYLPVNVSLFGTRGDPQAPGCYSHYGDVAMDTLLVNVKPVMEKYTKLKLIETYSYARIYDKGAELTRHKDRESCEISTTMNLGGDPWPIYIEPTGKENKKGVKVNLKPGDMLIYRGCDLEHWREPFTKKECVQVFLHFQDAKSKKVKSNLYDGRPVIGVPAELKQ